VVVVPTAHTAHAFPAAKDPRGCPPGKTGENVISSTLVGNVPSHSNKPGRVAPLLHELRSLAELAAHTPDVAMEEIVVPWRVRRRLKAEQIDEIVRKYEAGMGTPELCAEYGISKPAMLQLLHKQGVVMRRQPLTLEQRAEAVRLYVEDGLAIKPIAQRLGSSYGAVHRVLLEERVQLRPRSGRQTVG
jgi:hypothetical protein